MAMSLAMQAVEVINEIGIFDILVPFIMGAAAIFGMLEKTKLFGDRHDVNAMVGIAVGIVTAISFTSSRFIMNFMPIVIIFSFFIFVAVLLILWMGVKPETLVKFLHEPAIWIMLIIIIISLVVVGLQQTRIDISGGNITEDLLGTPSSEVTPETLIDPWDVVTQPKVVGVIVVLALFAIITYMMTSGK